MGINYVWEKFHKVVRAALLSDGTPKQRLSCCVDEFHGVEHELPPDFLQRFAPLLAACTREVDPTGEIGTWRATTLKMDDAEAKKWLDVLLSLYDEATRRDGAAGMSSLWTITPPEKAVRE